MRRANGQIREADAGASFTLFATAFGTCGLAWSTRGLIAVQLPEADEARTRARLQRRLATRASAPASLPANAQRSAPSSTAPGEARAAIASIVALFAADGPAQAHADERARAHASLQVLTLDDADQPALYRRIHALVRAIPPGSTRTYGEIARDLGDIALARAVGQAMGRNPWPIIVPCHRVLGSDGALTGFSAHGGVATKRRMLAIEGVHLPHTPSLFDDGAIDT